MSKQTRSVLAVTCKACGLALPEGVVSGDGRVLFLCGCGQEKRYSKRWLESLGIHAVEVADPDDGSWPDKCPNCSAPIHLDRNEVGEEEILSCAECGHSFRVTRKGGIVPLGD